MNHYGLAAFTGRGAPEIDILESMQGDDTEKLPNTFIRRPYQSSSLQVAPGVEIDRPVLGKRPHPVSVDDDPVDTDVQGRSRNTFAHISLCIVRDTGTQILHILIRIHRI